VAVGPMSVKSVLEIVLLNRPLGQHVLPLQPSLEGRIYSIVINP
jgi:hypothetical protein